MFSLRKKFRGSCNPTQEGSTIMSAITDSRAVLIPFTVDHLGGLGPLALSFLFDKDASPLPFPPPLQHDTLAFNNQASSTAYLNAITSPVALASKASSAWKQLHPTSRFGTTHHTHTPSQWALQALSLNISLALANSLQTAITFHTTPPKSSSTSHPQPSAFKGPTPYSFQRRPSPVHIAADPPTPVSPTFPRTFWSRGTHRLHGS